jgi:hypothetical protein
MNTYIFLKCSRDIYIFLVVTENSLQGKYDFLQKLDCMGSGHIAANVDGLLDVV